MKKKILVVDDEESIIFIFKRFLLDNGYEVETAGNYEEALTKVGAYNFDLIYADIILGGRSGIDLLKEIRKKDLNVSVVIITGCPSVETAAEVVRLGAFDYIPKPILKDALLRVTRTALRQKELVDEKERYRMNLEAIFNSVKDAIITVDKNMSVLEINEAAGDICNLTRDIIGMPVNSLPGYCGRKCLVALEETMSKRQPVELYHVECKHRLRPDQVVSVTAYPLLSREGVFTGSVLVVYDETPVVGFEPGVREREGFCNIIGKSRKMQELYTQINNLAKVNTTVLITGESGTGKELVVDALHYTGERRERPLVKVNCSAIPETLIESELFGHVKGAFTGAERDRIGRFQMADGGTILLDEIGDITLDMQLRLLRVLQEREIDRMGDSATIKVDVRVVAATNQDLRRKIKQGKFREDLYYRLNVVNIHLPPLRERKEDILLLVSHFLDEYNKEFNKKIVALSTDVLKIFMDHSWPGNVRELKHVIEYAFVHCRKDIITVEDIPSVLRVLTEIQPLCDSGSGAVDLQTILQALKKASWNRAKAARLLGMSRSTFYRKIEEYKINLEDVCLDGDTTKEKMRSDDV